MCGSTSADYTDGGRQFINHFQSSHPRKYSTIFSSTNQCKQPTFRDSFVNQITIDKEILQSYFILFFQTQTWSHCPRVDLLYIQHQTCHMLREVVFKNQPPFFKRNLDVFPLIRFFDDDKFDLFPIRDPKNIKVIRGFHPPPVSWESVKILFNSLSALLVFSQAEHDPIWPEEVRAKARKASETRQTQTRSKVCPRERKRWLQE